MIEQGRDFNSMRAAGSLADAVASQRRSFRCRLLLPLCLALLVAAASPVLANAPVEYHVDLSARAHHEARITVTFTDVARDVLEVRMSRSSPGRYALHEFAKNVYSVAAENGEGSDDHGTGRERGSD